MIELRVVDGTAGLRRQLGEPPTLCCRVWGVPMPRSAKALASEPHAVANALGRAPAPLEWERQWLVLRVVGTPGALTVPLLLPGQRAAMDAADADGLAKVIIGR